MRLTDIAIRNLEKPKKGAVIYPDDVLAGFGVRVSEGGTKSFVLTHGVRRQRETIGRVGVISLADARAEAKRLLAEYTLGKHWIKPVSWDDAKKEYLAEKKSELRERTLEDYTYHLGRHFRFGSTRLPELAPSDLTDSLRKLRDRPSTQRYAYSTLRAFMRWAHRKHYVDRNPMERMQCPTAYVPRSRVLSTEELAKIWHACGDDTFGRIVQLLILTGQRRGEITQLTSGMVGRDTITLPAWLTKNGRDHTLPLGTMAKVIIGQLSPRDVCLFPGRGVGTPFDGFSKCKPKLEKRAGVYDWTIHDLRRTFASGLASCGVAIPVIERLLNHVSGSFGGIVGVYQRYDFMTEMRDGIERWEARVADIAGR
jgi:integrase